MGEASHDSFLCTAIKLVLVQYRLYYTVSIALLSLLVLVALPMVAFLNTYWFAWVPPHVMSLLIMLTTSTQRTPKRFQESG